MPHTNKRQTKVARNLEAIGSLLHIRVLVNFLNYALPTINTLQRSINLWETFTSFRLIHHRSLKIFLGHQHHVVSRKERQSRRKFFVDVI